MTTRTTNRLVEGSLLLAGLLYYGLSLSRFPLSLWDEGYLYYVAHALQRGCVPYIDIQLYSYLPGLFYLFAGIFEIFGVSVFAARMLMLAGLTLTPWLLYRIARQLANQAVAFGIAAVVLLVPGPWWKFYVGLLNVGLLYCALRLLTTTSRGWSFAYGVVAGIALNIRIDAAFSGFGLLLVVFALHVWLRQGETRRTDQPCLMTHLFPPLLAGVTLTVLPVQLFLASHDILLAYYAQYADFTGMITPRLFSAENLSPPALQDLFDIFERTWAAATAWVFYLSFIPLVGLTLFILWQWFGEQSGPARQTHLAALILVAIWAVMNTPQYAFERPDVSHLTQRGPAILLPLGILLSAVLGWSQQGRSRVGRGVAIAVAVGLSAYAGLYAIKHLVCNEGGGYRFYAHSAQWRTLSNGLSYPTVPHASVGPLVEYILRHTEDNDTIAALPYFPGVNFLSQRLMPGRHVYAIPEVMRPGLQDELIHDITSARYVIYLRQQNIHRTRSSEPKHFLPQVDSFLMNNFQVVMKHHGVSLLERRVLP